MNFKDFREKLMKYRISTGREPYFIYVNYEDLQELTDDDQFDFRFFNDGYQIKPIKDIPKGELVMKHLPSIWVETNGIVTADGHPIGNINYEPEWKLATVPLSLNFRKYEN